MNESLPQKPQEIKGGTRDEIVNESRRKFLKEVGIAGAITASIIATPKTIDVGRKVYGETIDRENVEKEIASLRERLRTERGVDVDFSEIFPKEKERKIEGDALEYLIEERAICEMLLSEFALYPTFVYKDAGLFIIRVLNSFKYNGKQQVAGLAGRLDGVMYLEYEEKKREIQNMDERIGQIGRYLFPSIKGNIQSMQTCFHHEMEHFVEYTDENIWAKKTRGFGYGEGTGWEGVPYTYYSEIDPLVSSGQISEEDSKKFKIGTKGFVRKYGRENPVEDRATIAEALFTQEDMDMLHERLKTDKVLAKKVAGLKKVYFEKSCGTMDTTYWKLVGKNEIERETVAKYLTLRATMLIRLSDEAFARYVEEGRGGPCTKEEVSEWREKLLGWVEGKN